MSGELIGSINAKISIIDHSKIKGAGSGIGRATARIFAREGAKIIAADRNVEAAKDTIKEIGSGMYF